MVLARPLPWVLVLSQLAGGGCVAGGGKGETASSGHLVVDPRSIDFGVLDADDVLTEVVSVSNEGSDTVEISGLTLRGADAFVVSADHMLNTLYAGESTEFRVTYTASGGIDEGSVTVESDDPVSPELAVELVGGLAPALLVFDPDPLDFGDVALGEESTLYVGLSAGGGTELTLSDLTLDGAAFSIGLPTFPLTLSVGEETLLAVTFSPTELGKATGTLTASADADEDLEAELVGTGIEGEVLPVAVCSAEPDVVTSHDETAAWTGWDSYDPSGGTIEDYYWTLISQPEGSTATMPSGGANRLAFAWDLAGTYVAELVVTNDAGAVSEPCTATLTAIPDDELWIEMYWSHSGDDMDLHLLAPGGELNSILSDCYFSNCTSGGLDWGEEGEDADDPSLDLDDIPGTGPENIRIASPEEGTFTVYVHDYPTTVYSGANAVTVNIYIGGALAWTETQEISGEDEMVDFASISFPDGTVTAD